MSEREKQGGKEREKQGGDGEFGVCHVCGQRFDSQELLSQHLMEHAEED